MLTSIIILLFLWLCYKLFVAGYFFKIIVYIFGWWGLYITISNFFPSASAECIRVAGESFSYAQAIPTLLVLFAMFFTKAE